MYLSISFMLHVVALSIVKHSLMLCGLVLQYGIRSSQFVKHKLRHATNKGLEVFMNQTSAFQQMLSLVVAFEQYENLKVSRHTHTHRHVHTKTFLINSQLSNGIFYLENSQSFKLSLSFKIHISLFHMSQARFLGEKKCVVTT